MQIDKIKAMRFLKDNGVNIEESNFIDILSTPLMLRLYIEQEHFKNSDKSIRVKSYWIDHYNEGSLIWNY